MFDGFSLNPKLNNATQVIYNGYLIGEGYPIPQRTLKIIVIIRPEYINICLLKVLNHSFEEVME